MLTIFKLLLSLGVFCCASSHWICDSAKKPCNGLTLKGDYIKEGLADWFHESTEVEGMVVDSICAIVCGTQNCAAFFSTQNSVCILGTQTELQTDSESSAKFISMEDCSNVALNKQAYGSSVYYNYLPPHFAVDGDVTSKMAFFSTAVTDLDGWCIVDLASMFSIKSIRILGRQDALYHRLIDLTIYVGNTLVSNGDFSLYKTVGKVTTPSPSRTSWFVITPTLKERYRYVAVKKDISQGPLNIQEIEVYA